MLGFCCGQKYVFVPQALICYGKQLCTVPVNAVYYSYQNKYRRRASSRQLTHSLTAAESRQHRSHVSLWIVVNFPMGQPPCVLLCTLHTLLNPLNYLNFKVANSTLWKYLRMKVVIEKSWNMFHWIVENSVKCVPPVGCCGFQILLNLVLVRGSAPEPTTRKFMSLSQTPKLL